LFATERLGMKEGPGIPSCVLQGGVPSSSAVVGVAVAVVVAAALLLRVRLPLRLRGRKIAESDTASPKPPEVTAV
jgi:hypothetical protein